MATITLTLPATWDETLSRRMEALGTPSTEAYLLRLVEEDFAQEELEKVLLERENGPFVPLEEDWQERVREIALKRMAGET